ncbi:MAG: DUF1499 domain-containing protein [Albidovulum sp.]
MAYIRLAPSDPARWHVDPGTAEIDGEHRSVTLDGVAPDDVLDRLDAIAVASPRTLRLAGSPQEGRITWITRSAFFGFPDYTTAAARQEGSATLLTVHARQRFGRYDLGVNAARLDAWLGQLSTP